MVAKAIYSVTMVLWKETAFPLCSAMERRWKRNVVSPGIFCDSGDTPANLLYYYYAAFNAPCVGHKEVQVALSRRTVASSP